MSLPLLFLIGYHGRSLSSHGWALSSQDNGKMKCCWWQQDKHKSNKRFYSGNSTHPNWLFVKNDDKKNLNRCQSEINKRLKNIHAIFFLNIQKVKAFLSYNVQLKFLSDADFQMQPTFFVLYLLQKIMIRRNNEDLHIE